MAKFKVKSAGFPLERQPAKIKRRKKRYVITWPCADEIEIKEDELLDAMLALAMPGTRAVVLRVKDYDLHQPNQHYIISEGKQTYRVYSTLEAFEAGEWAFMVDIDSFCEAMFKVRGAF